MSASRQKRLCCVWWLVPHSSAVVVHCRSRPASASTSTEVICLSINPEQPYLKTIPRHATSLLLRIPHPASEAQPGRLVAGHPSLQLPPPPVSQSLPVSQSTSPPVSPASTVKRCRRASRPTTLPTQPTSHHPVDCAPHQSHCPGLSELGLGLRSPRLCLCLYLAEPFFFPFPFLNIDTGLCTGVWSLE